ncbi:BA14K family protein [Rhizobium sp. PAMB 3182]
MQKIARIAAGIVMSVAAVAPATPAGAFVASPPAVAAGGGVSGNVQDVRWVCDIYRNCYWRGGPRQIRPLPPPPRPAPGGYWNRHVRWCLDRYRSYNPRTNRFLSYSGDYRVCHSPWG